MSACTATIGNPNVPDIYSLQPSVTTLAEVQAKSGPPSSSTTAGDQRIASWMYVRAHSDVFSGTSNTHIVQLIFDRNGIYRGPLNESVSQFGGVEIRAGR